MYKKHENNIGEVWNEETKKEYSTLIESETNAKEDITFTYKEHTFQAMLREHYDMALQIEKKYHLCHTQQSP